MSGHVHDGMSVRRLDGIDLLVCPSLIEGARDTDQFSDYPYLELEYDPTYKSAIIKYINVKSDITNRMKIYFKVFL